MSKNIQNNKPSTVSKGFVWFHATALNGGAMGIQATISTYFSLYVQEDIGITAAQLSVVMLITSLWDVFTTPVMGVVCDSVRPRWGRYRTWFTFTPILLLIDMLLLFSNPGFIQGSPAAKCGEVPGPCCSLAGDSPHHGLLPAQEVLP